jgi:uncharacterized membrane protein YecN with MAPEG domain
MIPIPVTLSTAAACVFLNLWLGSRIAKLRVDYKVSVGDGGHEPLLRRMRAQANFIEHAPFVLILIGALELSGANAIALAVIAAAFVLARISHGIGMDGVDLHRWRAVGMITSSLITVGLALWAIFAAASALSGR